MKLHHIVSYSCPAAATIKSANWAPVLQFAVALVRQLK
jgi:hypothetical protein